MCWRQRPPPPWKWPNNYSYISGTLPGQEEGDHGCLAQLLKLPSLDSVKICTHWKRPKVMTSLCTNSRQGMRRQTSCSFSTSCWWTRWRGAGHGLWQVQSYQSSDSNCADQYCEENKDIFIILLCTIFLEFPDEVPMGKIFLQSFNLWELEKNCDIPTSRFAWLEPSDEVKHLSYRCW